MATKLVDEIRLRENVLSHVTHLIMANACKEARAFLKEVRGFEKMTCTTMLNAITMRDLHQAIVEAELSAS